jgi:hypothetical protein
MGERENIKYLKKIFKVLNNCSYDIFNFKNKNMSIQEMIEKNDAMIIELVVTLIIHHLHELSGTLIADEKKITEWIELMNDSIKDGIKDLIGLDIQ